jgi:hypothetical protein
MDKQHILDEIRRTAKANGDKPLGIRRFKAQTGIAESDWSGKHWVRWGDALIEAGYKPNTLQQAYDEEFVIGKLVELIQTLGHYPVVREMKMLTGGGTGFPSHRVFQRVGRKHELAQKAVDYCRKQGGLDEVIAICEPIAEMEPKESSDESDDGFVYLIRSGKNDLYKIGRSNDPDVRRANLATGNPAELSIVHKIQTDDSVGIEDYWHRRFFKNRVRPDAEWFKLKTADVKVFKRL